MSLLARVRTIGALIGRAAECAERVLGFFKAWVMLRPPIARPNGKNNMLRGALHDFVYPDDK